MFTIYYVHLHKLFKKKLIDATAAFFEQSVCEENAVFTVQNVNATRRRRRFRSLDMSTLPSTAEETRRQRRRSEKSTNAGSLWNCGKLYYS